jgi:tRNA 2-thiouridine synthesizing protein A
VTTQGPGTGGRAPARPEPVPGPAAAEAPSLTLDALGKKCPIPIIMLAERVRDVGVGQTIEVLADDPAAKTDVPAWCMLKSHEFVQAVDRPTGWSFLVRRSY